VGDGPFRPKLEKESRELGISDSVIFWGNAPYEQIPDLLAASDLFVTASTSEVHPLSLLESLASGKAVLAPRVEAFEEMIDHGENGWLVPLELETFKAKWIECLTNSDWRKKAEAKARASSQRFHYQKLAKEWINFYQDLLNHK
jgi:glycosyltransferase involved in cell wall biosynthesis